MKHGDNRNSYDKVKKKIIDFFHIIRWEINGSGTVDIFFSSLVSDFFRFDDCSFFFERNVLFFLHFDSIFLKMLRWLYLEMLKTPENRIFVSGNLKRNS